MACLWRLSVVNTPFFSGKIEIKDSQKGRWEKGMQYPYQPVPPQGGPYPWQYNSQYNTPQDRLKAMEQQYPHLAPPPVSPFLKGRPVTCLDEAKAAQIDYDGSVHVFTDIANGRIYTKQLGMNGTVVFSTYSLTAPVSAAADSSAEVNAAEVSSTEVSSTEVESLKNRVAELETKFKELIGNVQSNADNRNASKQRKSNAVVNGNGGE